MCIRDRDFRIHQRVVKNDLRAFQQPECSQRQQVFGTRTGTDQIDRSGRWGQRIIPAPTVLFVASSITMKAPVARFAE